MRRLVINADDFGLTLGVNLAIAEAHEHGVVTSATLMANSAQFDEAVRLAASSPNLSVGCHVVLVDGVPVLAPERVATLIGEDGKGFRHSWTGFARAAAGNRLGADEIEAEATAQIRKLQAAGVAVSHVDTHKHVHMLPQVLQPLLRAAKACGVCRIRNPFEPVRAAQLGRWPHLWKRWISTGMLYRYAASFLRTIKSEGMFAPDGCLGIVATGVMDGPMLAWTLQHVPQGTWELVCHPGYVDGQLREVRTRLRESRAVELRLLTSTATRELLAGEKIELLSYGAVDGRGGIGLRGW